MYLAAIAAHTGAGTTTLYYSSGGPKSGFVSAGGDTPANVWFDPRMEQPALLRRDVFGGGRTLGRSRTGHGELILTNGDGGLDSIRSYGFDGRQIIIYEGAGTEAFPGGWKKLMVGTIENVSLTRTEFRLQIRDRQLIVDVPLQTTKYLGDNSLPAGLEGVADLKGKPKPILFGKVLNVAPPQVNTSKLIFQPNDGALNSVDAVYDKGVPLGRSLEDLTERTNPATGGGDSIFGMAYADSLDLYVAVGQSSTITTSPDAATWTSRANGFSGAINDVTWSEDDALFVAGGASGELFTSPDGTTWTSRTSQFGADAINRVEYASGLYVAVGQNGKVSTSTNGTTWTSRTSGHGASAINGVAFGALGVRGATDLWVICGVGGKLSTSTGGTTWTLQSSGFGVTQVIAVEYLNDLFFASSTEHTRTSPDGVSWGPWANFDSGDDLRSSGYSNGLWVVTGTAGLLAFSLDGANYVRATWVASGNAIFAVIVRPGIVVMAGTRVATTTGPETYASEADLLDDTKSPAPGSYKSYLAGGYIRLGSPPIGQITVDATQGANAAARTAGQLFALTLPKAGLSSGDWSAGDVTALDSANSSVCGYWSGTRETTVATVLDQIAQSVGAWWGIDRAGVFRIKQFTAPSGSAVLSFVAADMVEFLERLPTRDRASLPVYRTLIRHSRNYTVQDGGALAGAVSDVRRGVLAQAFQEEISTDASVQTKHLLAGELILETLLQVAANAATEAARVQTLRGADRNRFEFTVPLDSETVVLDLGDVITITHSRFGLSGGVDFRVITLGDNADDSTLLIGCWG